MCGHEDGYQLYFCYVDSLFMLEQMAYNSEFNNSKKNSFLGESISDTNELIIIMLERDTLRAFVGIIPPS